MNVYDPVWAVSVPLRYVLYLWPYHVSSIGSMSILRPSGRAPLYSSRSSFPVMVLRLVSTVCPASYSRL